MQEARLRGWALQAICVAASMCAPALPTVATATALAAPVTQAPAPVAVASGAVTSVKEYGSLQLESSKGSTVDERGRGWGTFTCNVYIQMTLSGTTVRATYSAYPHGGSIVGTAIAQIHSATTKQAQFSGTITLIKGTGSYAHASGRASFKGAISRTSYALSVEVAGRLQL